MDDITVPDVVVVDVGGHLDEYDPNIQDSKQYVGHFINFMKWFHSCTYPKSQRFSQRQLLEVKPIDVFKYFCIRAFGVEVLETGSRPTLLRGSTLEFYKKAISHYMPNKGPAWDVRTNSGNPTKSALVNGLLARVARHELALQGASAKAKRPLSLDEFKMLLKIFEQQISFQVKFRFATMAKYQFHLIGRSDDVANFKIRDLVGHSDNKFKKFSLMCKVRVSKTAKSDKTSQYQIFLGSMDSNTCLLLALAIYLESWMSFHNGQSCVYLFSGETTITETTIENLKNTFLQKLKDLTFEDPTFRQLSDTGEFEDLGSHSLRKFAATFARENGCTPEDIEIRGRWKTNMSRVVHSYISLKQPYIDAKVQAAICVGGPIKYVLRQGTGISVEWLLQNVVPGITLKYNNNKNGISEVLALALLWAVQEGESIDVPIPPELRKKIKNAYETLRAKGICTLDNKINPVERINLCVYRVGSNLHIDEYQGGGSAMVNGNAAARAASNNNDSKINGLMIQMQQTRKQLESAISVMNGNHNSLSTQFDERFSVLNRTVNRILVRPDRVANPTQRNEQLAIQEMVEAVVQLKPAELSKLPKNLHDLWNEYQFGTGGRKAARDFSTSERGKVKSMYSRRNRVWEVIATLVRAGYTAPAAINLVYITYGKCLSVNQIIDSIVRETKNGGQIHINLRI